jgi:hypothetical protein
MDKPVRSPTDAACRLCGGVTTYLFSKRILSRHDVGYHQCQECGSQQTDFPSWLDEAYAIPGLHIDVGAPTRSIKNWLATTVLLDSLGIPLEAKGVDFGAGPGLFASLMRSVGRDFHTFDAFTRPIFSSYSSISGLGDMSPDILTAFEVFEHLPEPKATLDDLFSREVPLILFTTWPVDDQAEDWIYYLPDCGQHVFFYSREALERQGKDHGYDMVASQYFYILYDPALLSEQQIEAISNFSLNSIALLEQRVSEIVLGVIMGNSFLDAELAAAIEQFRINLPATDSDA